MAIVSNADIVWELIVLENTMGVSMQILLGEEHGSREITVRNFSIAPDGYSLHHKHNYEHLVQITKGEGVFLDDSGIEHEVKTGQSIFIPCNEMHQFLNKSDEDFVFTCTIKNQI